MRITNWPPLLWTVLFAVGLSALAILASLIPAEAILSLYFLWWSAFYGASALWKMDAANILLKGEENRSALIVHGALFSEIVLIVAAAALLIVWNSIRAGQHVLSMWLLLHVGACAVFSLVLGSRIFGGKLSILKTFAALICFPLGVWAMHSRLARTS